MNSSDRFLKKVILNSDVYAGCLQHALTTEKEEVMGLLIGEVNEKERISKISAFVILHRSDKQPDRVEISPEQLCTASTYAEELASKLERPMRVIGWYHSHPHITVWPSHVDLRTQLMYQMMDPLFVGLIFAVYQNEIGSTANNIQVTAFQAIENRSEQERREILLEIKNSPFEVHNHQSVASLPKILWQEADSHEESIDKLIVDELAMLHNDAFKTMDLVNVVSKVTKPLYENLEARLNTLYIRLAELEKIKQKLSELQAKENSQKLSELQAKENSQKLSELQAKENSQKLSELQANENSQKLSELQAKENSQKLSELQAKENSQKLSELQAKENSQKLSELQAKENSQKLSELQAKENSQKLYELQSEENSQKLSELQDKENSQKLYELQSKENSQKLSELQDKENSIE